MERNQRYIVNALSVGTLGPPKRASLMQGIDASSIPASSVQRPTNQISVFAH